MSDLLGKALTADELLRADPRPIEQRSLAEREEAFLFVLRARTEFVGTQSDDAVAALARDWLVDPNESALAALIRRAATQTEAATA